LKFALIAKSVLYSTEIIRHEAVPYENKMGAKVGLDRCEK
jgi:hypothetical protein